MASKDRQDDLALSPAGDFGLTKTMLRLSRRSPLFDLFGLFAFIVWQPSSIILRSDSHKQSCDESLHVKTDLVIAVGSPTLSRQINEVVTRHQAQGFISVDRTSSTIILSPSSASPQPLLSSLHNHNTDPPSQAQPQQPRQCASQAVAVQSMPASTSKIVLASTNQATIVPTTATAMPVVATASLVACTTLLPRFASEVPNTSLLR